MAAMGTWIDIQIFARMDDPRASIFLYNRKVTSHRRRLAVTRCSRITAGAVRKLLVTRWITWKNGSMLVASTVMRIPKIGVIHWMAVARCHGKMCAA